MSSPRILVIGAGGQLGYELTRALRVRHGVDNVVASDVKPAHGALCEGPFELLDATKKDHIAALVHTRRITQIYHLAAMLSATGEQAPQKAWDLNMGSLLAALEVAVMLKLERVYWPSSIAVFGPTTPRHNTPQDTVISPTTVYGISKLAGERWCEYYFRRYGLDVRSIRYPGLISYEALPGGGVTDYAIEIYQKAARSQHFSCFLKADTYLPMMYIDDAIRATLELMEAPAEQVKVRSSYNLSAMSLSPAVMAASIRNIVPNFVVEYQPDYRQAIAKSWPASIDDSAAQVDWGWAPRVDLETMTRQMLQGMQELANR